ncbi:MAG: hypothetical protein GY696_39655, partial [Gammaproteobacteria bacterium]|nr:hypothetical protein [Gammaproteobacteria bacterium]
MWDSADCGHLKFDLLDASDGGQRNWRTEVWEAPSIHHAAAQFQDKISLAQAQYVPHKKITLRRSQCPWFSKPLLRKIERKNKAFKAMNRNRNPTTVAKYLKANKSAKVACLQAKKASVVDSFNSMQSSKDFWKTVKKFSSKKPTGTSIPLQKPDGSVAFTSAEKASALSAEFQKNFNPIDCPAAPISPGDILSDWWCEEHEVFAEILKLKDDSAIGLDGISARTLKKCVAQIVKPVTHILNRCLYEAEFPDCWKMAK